jgi:amino acid transporter
MADGGSEVGYERLGAKRLSLVDVIAQSVGFMGPVFSAAFLIPLIAGIGAAQKGAGVATPFAVILAAIGVFALGWIVAEYAKKVHAAGSLYDYVSLGLGGKVGGIAGWLYYSGTTVLASAIAVLIGGLIHDTLFTADPAAPGIVSAKSPLPIWAWSLVYVAAVFLIMYLGVRISTRVQLTLSLISVIVVLIFAIDVIIKVGSGNSLSAFNPSKAHDGWSGIFFGVMYGVLIFVGFETAANLAEETTEPKRSIPRAVLLTVVIATVFYVILAYAQVAGFRFDLNALFSAAAAPLFALASPTSAGGYGSNAILKIVEIVVILDVMAVGLGAAVASSRGVFALARDRRLPAPLAKVSASRGTPAGAIIFVSAWSLAMVILTKARPATFALPLTPAYFSMFLWLSSFGAFALVVVYAALSIGAFNGLADGRSMAGVVIAGILGLIISAGAIFGAIYKVPSPTNLVVYYAAVWLIVGVVVTLMVKGREPASQALGELRSSA